jgi:uncharacterized membrane protein
MSDVGGEGYRVDPASVRAIVANVRAEPIERDGIRSALHAALEGIRNVDDEITDEIVFVLSGIAGDVEEAPARIDARVARAAKAAIAALDVVEQGDSTMAQEVAASERRALEVRALRFGSGPS